MANGNIRVPSIQELTAALSGGGPGEAIATGLQGLQQGLQQGTQVAAGKQEQFKLDKDLEIRSKKFREQVKQFEREQKETERSAKEGEKIEREKLKVEKDKPASGLSFEQRKELQEVRSQATAEKSRQVRDSIARQQQIKSLQTLQNDQGFLNQEQANALAQLLSVEGVPSKAQLSEDQPGFLKQLTGDGDTRFKVGIDPEGFRKMEFMRKIQSPDDVVEGIRQGLYDEAEGAELLSRLFPEEFE